MKDREPVWGRFTASLHHLKRPVEKSHSSVTSEFHKRESEHLGIETVALQGSLDPRGKVGLPPQRLQESGK